MKNKGNIIYLFISKSTVYQANPKLDRDKTTKETNYINKQFLSDVTKKIKFTGKWANSYVNAYRNDYCLTSNI